MPVFKFGCLPRCVLPLCFFAFGWGQSLICFVWFGRQTIQCTRLVRDTARLRSLTLSLSQKFLCVNVMKSTFQLKPFCIWKKAECLFDSQIFAALSCCCCCCVRRFPPLYYHQEWTKQKRITGMNTSTQIQRAQIHAHIAMCATHTSTKSITAATTTTTVATAAAMAIAVSCTLSLPYIEPFQWWIRRKLRFVPHVASIGSLSTTIYRAKSIGLC